jgi:hypothetical protein
MQQGIFHYRGDRCLLGRVLLASFTLSPGIILPADMCGPDAEPFSRLFDSGLVAETRTSLSPKPPNQSTYTTTSAALHSLTPLLALAFLIASRVVSYYAAGVQHWLQQLACRNFDGVSVS